MLKRKSSRNTQGSGSIRQRFDGRWEGRYTVGVNPATGKQDQRSLYGDTEAAVAKQLRKIVQEIDDGFFIEPSKLTVGKWMDIWVSDFLGHVKDGARVDYQAHIRNHIKPSFGVVKLSALTAIHIQQLYNGMIARQLSGKTVKNLHAVIHGALKQALRLGYVRTNVSDACTLPRAEKVPIKPLDLPDVKLFMQAIRGTEYENLYTVALFTGMREAELSGLQWRCVNFQQGTIKVDKQLMRPRGKAGAYRFASVKNDKVRIVHPASLVMDALKAQRKTQLEQRLRMGADWNYGGFPDLVFTKHTGEHLSFNTILNRFQAALKKAGLENRRFHDLRHSYGVTALQAGGSIKDVSENLGHATAGFTADVYLHVTPSMKEASAKRMQTLIENEL